MSWDNVTLVILAAFGCVTLLLTQIAEVLSKLPEIIRAWHEVRRTLQAGPGNLPEAQDPREVNDPAPGSGGGTPRRQSLCLTDRTEECAQEPGVRRNGGGCANRLCTERQGSRPTND